MVMGGDSQVYQRVTLFIISSKGFPSYMFVCRSSYTDQSNMETSQAHYRNEDCTSNHHQNESTRVTLSRNFISITLQSLQFRDLETRLFPVLTVWCTSFENSGMCQLLISVHQHCPTQQYGTDIIHMISAICSSSTESHQMAFSYGPKRTSGLRDQAASHQPAFQNRVRISSFRYGYYFFFHTAGPCSLLASIPSSCFILCSCIVPDMKPQNVASENLRTHGSAVSRTAIINLQTCNLNPIQRGGCGMLINTIDSG